MLRRARKLVSPAPVIKISPGTITVKLGDPSGRPGDAQYLCQANIANAQRGTYAGFITLTLTVL